MRAGEFVQGEFGGVGVLFVPEGFVEGPDEFFDGFLGDVGGLGFFEEDFEVEVADVGLVRQNFVDFLSVVGSGVQYIQPLNINHLLHMLNRRIIRTPTKHLLLHRIQIRLKHIILNIKLLTT